MHFPASLRLLPVLSVLATVFPSTSLLHAYEAGLTEIGSSGEFVRFAAVGGASGSPDGRKRVDARVRSWAPDFTVPLGDSGEAGYPDLIRGPVQVFSVDAAAGMPSQRLRKALAASSATWKIVCIHNAAPASDARGCNRAPRLPFREWGADAVISGQGRGYERFLADGVPFFVNGPGGKPGYPAGDPMPGSQCLFAEEDGAMLIEADGERIDFRFVTAEGLVVDSHTLRKAPVPGSSAAVRASARIPRNR